MSNPQSPDPVAHLAATLALAEADGRERLARVLARTSLPLPEIAKALAASPREDAAHTAAIEAGAAVAKALLDLPPASDLDEKVGQAVADVITPSASAKTRH